MYPAETAGFEVGSISWVCETSDAGACCNTQSTACGLNAPTDVIDNDELHAIIDLDAQTEVVFTVTGTISSQASGVLTNAATAQLPIILMNQMI